MRLFVPRGRIRTGRERFLFRGAVPGARPNSPDTKPVPDTAAQARAEIRATIPLFDVAAGRAQLADIIARANK